MGFILGFLLDILDPNGCPAKMTINGIPIDITKMKALSTLNKLSKYPAEAIIEALCEIRKAINMYFKGTKCYPTLEILHTLQSAHIQVQNKLFANKSRHKDRNLYPKLFTSMLKR